MHLLWKYTNDVCDKPQCFRCSIRQGRPPQLWRSTNHMARSAEHVDLFVGPSVFTIHKHLERGFTRPMVHLPPLHRPPQGNEAQPGKKGSANETPVRPYFFCAGRLEDYKGFQDVIPVFRKFPDHDLVICGHGSFQDALETLAADSPNVRIIGERSLQRRHALYQGAVATIVPSRCFQTFCHTTVESFSAGTPVVAFRRSAVEELISEQGGGILYTNTDELEAALTSLIGDGQLRQTLQARVRTVFEQEYSEATYTRRYLRIIEALMEQKLSRSPVSGSLEAGQSLAGRRVFGA